MKHVIHLMPYNGIGGVELAAKSTLGHEHPDIMLELAYIFPHVASRAQRGATFNPLYFFAAAKHILKAKPDLLVVSLWRACIVGLFVKLANPRIKLVTFIHNSKDAHIFDRILNRLSVRLSMAVYFDSESSRQERLAVPPGKHNAVIPFLINRIAPLPLADNMAATGPRFIFWGRLNPQKNLPAAIDLFAKIHANKPDSRFDIIGPDGGEADNLKAQVNQLGLSDAVTFHGPLSWPEITKLAAGARFYLQTSHYEGMSIAVTEAMQLGLIPIVTPVGEVGTYCDGSNALILHNKIGIVDYAPSIIALSEDTDRQHRIRQAAITHWQDHPLYCEALFDQLSLLVTDDFPIPSAPMSER